MFHLAFKMLRYRLVRLIITVAGLSCLFLLSAGTVGLLVGWCNTTSAIISGAEADVWVSSTHTTAFDYASPMPDIRLQQVRSVAGVATADAMISEWGLWQAPNGKRITVELIGLDASLTGAPAQMAHGDASVILRPDSVIVDEIYLDQLGVNGIGDEVEILNQRATVRGTCRGIRTFTASPFVFTSLRSARRYSGVYGDKDITHVMVRCQPGVLPADLCQRIENEIPYVDAMTSKEFARRTSWYWMLKTGAGTTVVLVASLGFCVSALVVSQILFSITHENLPVYATLLAVGFSQWKLSCAAVYQGLQLGLASLFPGGCGLILVTQMSAQSAVAVEMNPSVLVVLTSSHMAACVVASLLSVRSVFATDSTLVFRT
jgi:putative ABC transport system permease protein